MRIRTVLGLLAVSVACSRAVSRPGFTLDLRRPTWGHNAWYHALATRYACDTLLLKSTYPPPPNIGASVCAVAAWIQPYAVRAWDDSSTIVEEWDFKNGQRTYAYSTGLIDPSLSAETNCQLVLEGTSPPFLRVREYRC